MKNLSFVKEISEAHFLDLCNLFKQEWWSYYRKPEDIRTLLNNSDIVLGIVEKESGRLIAFARMLTDYVFRSMIYDVIVAKDYRNKGIGRMLLKGIIDHPGLKRVELLELQTQPELIPFYEQFGFNLEIVGKMKTLRMIKHNKK